MPAGRLGTGIWRLVRQHDRAWARERLLIVVLDESGQVVHTREVPVAGLTAATLRRVFKGVPLDQAAGFISIHNHPNRRPSKRDGAIAMRLKQVADEAGLQLFDHMIFWRGNYHRIGDRGRR